MKNNKKIYITLSIFAVVALSLVVFCIWPLIIEIEKNSEYLISAKNNVATLKFQIAEIKNFKNNYATYEPNFEKIDQLFIDPANPVDFITFLEGAASGSGVTSQISLPPSSQGTQKSGQNSIVLQLSSKGTFLQMTSFLKKIEAGPYLLEIENLSIQNSDQETNKNSKDKDIHSNYPSREVEATFSIKVFTKQ